MRHLTITAYTYVGSVALCQYLKASKRLLQREYMPVTHWHDRGGCRSQKCETLLCRRTTVVRGTYGWRASGSMYRQKTNERFLNLLSYSIRHRNLLRASARQTETFSLGKLSELTAIVRRA